MRSVKRKARDDGNNVSFKRKKNKIAKLDSSKARNGDGIDDSDIEKPKGELLNAQIIREGMLLLGCVTEKRATSFVMSLPGCLTGIVPSYNVSNAFTKSITTLSDDSDLEEPSLESIIHLGAVYPCKVIQISQEKSKKKPRITLSINPGDVNIDLKPSSLYPEMVLYVSVQSIEDRGYIADVGSACIKGFLPRNNVLNQNEMLKVGEVIPTYIKCIEFRDKKTASIQLAELSFDDAYPPIPVFNISLHSVLPGAKFPAYIISVDEHFAYMKFKDFDVCASIISFGSLRKCIKVAKKMWCTVLYVHPITNMIYVTLHPTPAPRTFSKYIRLRKFEHVKYLKLEEVYKGRAYYKINNGPYGFINMKDLPEGICTINSPSAGQEGLIPKACVICVHYMDNLVQMSAKPSLTEKKIILPQNVRVGDIYEAIVSKHDGDGMFVNICPGLYGFVRRLHMSDVFVTKPEQLFPLKSKVKCRVLFTDGEGKLSLTTKGSLLNLPDCYALSSYHGVQQGQYYKGVVVKVTSSFIVVLFFNNIQGIVQSSHIPESSTYFVGQTVVCEVLHCNPMRHKLKLSLQTAGWWSLEEIDDVLDKHCLPENESNQNSIKLSEVEDVDLTNEKVTSLQSYNGNHIEEFDASKPIQAVITKVTAHQLNIEVKGIKGRVHITEVECLSEGEYPLKKFKCKEEIGIYVIGEYAKKKRNYLTVTHQNTVALKECTLKLSTNPVSKIHKPGDSVIGFVKKVYDVYAEIWLSPTKVGILDYLHVCDKAKFVRKLQQNWKVGLSLKVSVLDDEHSPMRGRQSIALTKLDCKNPEVGKNILGLVQIACLERGLVVKLPFGYHGDVSITDLTDMYVSLHTLLERYRRLQYIQCHVLDVNHETKHCSLSLRKSRLFKKETTADNSFCPEITVENVHQGDIVKGYVTSVSDSAITVVFGKKLEGKIKIHSCTLTDCRACSNAKSALNKYPAGSVVEVIIDSISLGKKSFTLILPNNQNEKCVKYDRLSVKEDISWDEMV